ncbi:uncharacterized protein SETTUDRAFT_168680 [Exserohilum turcica Et28A]|uniref:Uncharacterized protein n=1 Tax=Exserohilum turcicum (strain 28A) TaxID=671987 RepID=R0KGA7_EXST2|nr:uncharacterized protein SETTUDRAFT_168680 [Exserohilum turcica Et28A]EOA88324.1 hypothetical protein SETTUDRAFT_168680 [Exserohilum turcica Et28A]
MECIVNSTSIPVSASTSTFTSASAFTCAPSTSGVYIHGCINADPIIPVTSASASTSAFM